MVATGSKPPYGVRFLPEKSKGVAAPILLGPRLSCSDACGVRVAWLSCGLRFTIWVTPGNRLTKLRTSWPLCFTTGFPGSPNGVSPQFSLLNSKPVHKLGDKSRDVGEVDIVVNNAGYFPNRSIDELDLATWRKTMATNLDSHFLSAKYFLSNMRRKKWGRFVGISSYLVGL